MELINKLKEDIKTSLKEQNKMRVSILKTLVGEMENKKDQDPVAIVKKFVANANETLQHMKTSAPFNPTKCIMIEEELAIYNEYLPEALSEKEVEAIARGYVLEGMNLGQVMGAFKKTYPNRYDGAQLSKFVKSII